MNVRELFRHKLGRAEIIPDASVQSKLMKKLAIREFLRFNPGRFNIYYLGGMLATAISAIFILSSGGENQIEQTNLNLSGEKNKTDSVQYFSIPDERNMIQKSDKLDEHSIETDNNKGIIKPEGKENDESLHRDLERVDHIITANNINDSFSKKSLFPEASPGLSKLQHGFKGKDALFEPSASEGCSPLKLQFYIKSESFDSCKWIIW